MPRAPHVKTYCRRENNLPQFAFNETRFLRRIDVNFCAVIALLIVIGLINLYSATHGPLSLQTNRLFIAQLIWIIVGALGFLVLTFVNYLSFHRLAWLIYALNVLALAAVEFYGRSSLGAQRWLDFGYFRYQPSETMKVVTVIILARLLTNKMTPGPLTLKDLVKPLIVTAIPFFLVVKQPDLGTAILIIAIAFSMILFVGVQRSILISGIIIALIAGWLGWNFGLRDFQKRRVEVFLSPGEDPRGAGWNSIQSRIAVGSGKFFGKGYMVGTQSQLEFLPERHTDFIFSVLSEEHGFVGSLFVVTLFMLLFSFGIRIAKNASDRFGSLIVIGVLSHIFWHMFVNMGMVVGLLPIVGVPLPLLSYGGSGMLSILCSLGMISSVAYRKYLF